MIRKYLHILAFLIGLLPGFFLVFNFMFSDVISLYERSLSFLIVIVTYLVLGAVFGFISRENGWKNGIFLSLPAIFLSLAYSVSEAGTALTNLSYAAAATFSAVTSANLGARLSKKGKQ